MSVDGYHRANHITARLEICDHTHQTKQGINIGILVFKRAFTHCPLSQRVKKYILAWLQNDQIAILAGSLGFQAHLHLGEVKINKTETNKTTIKMRTADVDKWGKCKPNKKSGDAWTS